ncbi:leucine-rich repeat domain-containing protein, partial [bacterium 1XD42-8]
MERIEIKGRVRKLEETFVGCSNLKEVKLPDTLIELGDSVLASCSSLEKINIPKQVEIIGEYAFQGCISLQEMEIPDSVKVINKGAFFGCIGMRMIRFPELTWIEPDEWDGVAFTGCTSLETIIAPKETIPLLKEVLEASDFFPRRVDVQIVEEEEEREERLYDYEKTKEGVVIYGYRGNERILEIPEQMEGKPVVAVEGNRENHQGFVGKGVEEVILPKTLKRIGSCAFEGTSVLSVFMDEGQVLEEIGEHGFKGCTQLGSIPRAKRIGIGAFEGCISLGGIDLQDVERIEDRAFYGCIFLKVKLGETLKLIGSEAFKYCNSIRGISFLATLERIGSMAFEECRNLHDIEMN